jgi:hypothetical protein
VASVTAIVEYDDSYADEELDELEQQLTRAGVSAQIQPLGVRAGFGEVAVCLSVLLGEVTAHVLLEEAMRMLGRAILSVARRHWKRLAASAELSRNYDADDFVIFEFNGLRISLLGEDLDDVEVEDLLVAASRLVQDDNERTRSWVWDSDSRELRPRTLIED